jgi:uracil-DNA glycosylase
MVWPALMVLLGEHALKLVMEKTKVTEKNGQKDEKGVRREA